VEVAIPVRVIRIALVGLLVVVLVGVALGIGALAWVTGRALPQTTGNLKVPGLHGPVTVARDINGIADISADDPHDLFMAQGYVHAGERMWQMEVWRHISSGRLAELFGAGSVDTDAFVRTLGWRQAAERDLAGMSSDTRAILDAYSEGVNTWLDANRGATTRSRGPRSTRLRGARSRRGTSAGTWTARSSATWPTRGLVTLPGPMSCSCLAKMAR